MSIPFACRIEVGKKNELVKQLTIIRIQAIYIVNDYFTNNLDMKLD